MPIASNWSEISVSCTSCALQKGHQSKERLSINSSPFSPFNSSKVRKLPSWSGAEISGIDAPTGNSVAHINSCAIETWNAPSRIKARKNLLTDPACVLRFCFMGYHLQSIIFVSHKLYFQRLPHNRTDVGGFYCIYLGIGHNTVNVIVSQCRQRHAGLVYAVEIGKKSAAAGQVIILAVQRENHGAGAANDLCAGNEAVNSAIGAVISIVA